MKILEVFKNNISTLYNSNKELSIIIIGFIVIYITIGVYIYKKNDKKNIVDSKAKSGEYSHDSEYVNISAMKHDIFKQMTIDVLPIIFIFGIPSLFMYINTGKSVIKFTDLLSFHSYNAFMNSIIGRTLLSAMGYLAYYQVIQPYIINTTKYF